jgi:hypothetical protein
MLKKSWIVLLISLCTYFTIHCRNTEKGQIKGKYGTNLTKFLVDDFILSSIIGTPSSSILVSAILYDANGDPIPNAKMEINNAQSNVNAKASTLVYTDAFGVYEITAQNGSLTISVTKEDGSLLGSFSLVVQGESTPQITNNNSNFYTTEPSALTFVNQSTLSFGFSAPEIIKPPVLSYSNTSFTYLVGMFVPPAIPRNRGGRISNCTITPDLPSGLSLSKTSCAIVGTPKSVDSSKSYKITASNNGGSSEANFNLEVVNPEPPSSLSYSGSPFSLSQSSQANITPTYLGGPIKSCTVTPSLASIGLSMDPRSCRIFGFPKKSQTSKDYTVTVSNSNGSTSTTIRIAVDQGSSVASSGGTSSAPSCVANINNWTERTSAEQNYWMDITYGNGLFVAVSQDGNNRIMTSPNGVAWISRNAVGGSTLTWSSVTYGNGLFVAVADGGTNRVMTSSNGISWTARTASPDNALWRNIVYANGLFVAVASVVPGNGVNIAMTSPDGINWTARNTPGSNSWTSVTYGNGLFVAVGGANANRVMTSPDGINWTGRTPAALNTWQSVTFGNGLFVAVSRDGGLNQVMTSPDGINWTIRSSTEANQWFKVVYGNGLFVAVSYTGTNRMMTSPDGITWTPRSVPQSGWFTLTYGNNQFVVLSHVSADAKQVLTACY